jgi:hypothetical protein
MLNGPFIVKKLVNDETNEPIVHSNIAEAMPKRPWESSGIGDTKIEINASIAIELNSRRSITQPE